MNILYLSNARIPTEKAHGVQIMKMCQALAGLGNKVTLVLPRRHNYTKKTPFEYYGIEESFKIKKFFCLDLIVLDKYLGNLGLWVENISFILSAFPYIIFNKADVIYIRDKLLLLCSLFKKNLIFETHTLPRNYFLYKLFFKRLRGVVAITQGLKDFFVKRGMPPDKILVAPDGVDLQEFNLVGSKEDYRRKLALHLDKKIVLYAGHFYGWKGATALLEVARNFQLPITNCQFVFVGGTKEDIAEFKEWAEKLTNVLVVGHRPHAEIPLWLKAADVLVLPNSGQEDISKYWTSPMKMFEYMASERPIIASDLPSIREILNKENAVLVEPDSPGALAQGIKEVLQNSQLSDRISARAFEDVKEYTWRKRAEKICQKIF